MRKYVYKGPVYHFNQIVINNWVAVTMAATPSKAMSNLCYRAKCDLKLIASAKIALDEKHLKEV